MVDVVLYMEGDPISSWRLLRSVKNRFGSTNEVGVFEMTSTGLVEVKDPSRALIAERNEQSIGSVVVPALEGSRPILVELQALTSPSFMPNPRRVSTGVDYNRLLLVCAVLTRRVGVSLSNQDVIVNVTGGFRINEPALDLGMSLAIASSLTGIPLDANIAAIGEVGLGGEIRMVAQLDRRVQEAARLGFETCLVPGSAPRDMDVEGSEIVRVKSLPEAIKRCFPELQRRSASKV
jgi:DNA repair protein RadA/Sms